MSDLDARTVSAALILFSTRLFSCEDIAELLGIAVSQASLLEQREAAIIRTMNIDWARNNTHVKARVEK